jgi:hypothetical protein
MHRYLSIYTHNMKAFTYNKAKLVFLLLLAIVPHLLSAQSTFSKTKSFLLSKVNGIYLSAGMDLAKQNIATGNYGSAFNYNLSNYNNNAFKPGFFAGISTQTSLKKNNAYSFDISVHRMSTGTNYKESVTLQPFLGTFSPFKADNVFWMLNTAVHYKTVLNISDTSKFKFRLVIGPSLDTRLSNVSEDNIAHSNYHRFVLKGDIGVEFTNRNYYTFFLHYKQGISSFTASPINTTLNSFDFGMLVKASDFF